MSNSGSNYDDKIKELVAQYVKCDEESAVLNDKRAEIRAKVKDILGEEASRALQDEIARLKKDRKKKEGYDEARAEVNRIIGMMDADSLFAWQVRREAEKEAAKEAKRKEREKEKASAETFKPATERKPKNEKTLGQVLSEAHPVVQ